MHPLLLDLPGKLETERLEVRPYRAGDGTWYHAMSHRNKAHLARYEADNPVMTIETVADAEVVVRDFAADWAGRKAFFLGAFRKDTGEFVAQVYIGVVNWTLPEFEIGYFSDCQHEGHGYVSEAVRAALELCFDALGASRVQLRCDETNIRSWRVAERCGFVREGHLRENKRDPDGRLGSTFLYGLLRREYLERHTLS